MKYEDWSIEYRIEEAKKDAWNEAIEAAANELRVTATGTWINTYIELIRKLKR